MDELKVRTLAREEAEDVVKNHMQSCDAWKQITPNPYKHQDHHGWLDWLLSNVGEVGTGLFKRFLFGGFVVVCSVITGGFIMYIILTLKK